MVLRVVELNIPGDDVERLDEYLGEIPVLHRWSSTGRDAETCFVRLLLDAKDVEALTDALVGHLGSHDGFRLVVLAVEATMPPVEEPEGRHPSGSDDETGTSDATDADETATEDGSPAFLESQRISREELYGDLAEASDVTPVYAAMVGLSTVVAAIGLIRGDVAVIIGAMVMAPLLGPNIALSLACTLGDLRLGRRSLKAIAIGVGVAAVLSVSLGLVLSVDPAGPQLVARTRGDPGDMLLALAAGAAGALAFTSGVSGVVVGVMVAVALLPPLVVAGLLVGSGHWGLSVRALVLLLTNVTCVNLAAVATFLIRKVRPRTWWEGERAKKATRVAVVIWIVLLAALLVMMWLMQDESRLPLAG